MLFKKTLLIRLTSYWCSWRSAQKNNNNIILILLYYKLWYVYDFVLCRWGVCGWCSTRPPRRRRRPRRPSPLRRRYIACLYVTCVLWSLGWKKITKIIMSNIKFLKIVLFPYFYYFLLLIAANIMRFMLSIFFSWLFCIIVSGLSSVSHRHHFWTQKLINIGKDYRYARNLHDSVNRCTQNHSI